MFTYLRILSLASLTLFTLSSHAENFEWSDLGLRVGFDGESEVSIRSYEAFAVLESPWEWQVSDSVTLDLEFEFGLGALDGEGETAAFGHLGPSLSVELGDLPFELVITTGPALLSEHEFDRLDLGGSFQFMSSIGVDFELGERWTLAYRFQHISNAGLHDRNPGLDLHAISLSRAF